MCVFVGENFWCFVFDTHVHYSEFFICMSNFRPRHITIVSLQRMCGQSYTYVQRQVAFGGLPLKSGGAWKLVQIQSLQGDLVFS